MKRNKLRRVYLVYIIAIAEILCMMIIIGAGYIFSGPWETAVRILGYVGAVLAPIVIYAFYRWLKKDNDTASDELEQMVLTKAMAAGGLVSISLVPFMLALVSLFKDWSALIIFIFAVIVGGTIKLRAFYLYRKY